MHARKKMQKVMTARIATVAVFLLGATGAAFGTGQAGTEGEAAALASAALAPYRNAHAYKGTLTTTAVVGKEQSRITKTMVIQSRSDTQGQISRLHAQTTSWGEENGKAVAGTEDCIVSYDGTMLWVYRPEAERYHREARKPSSLAALLGLPPLEAAWTFAPPSRDEEPDARAVRAKRGDEEWTLTLDKATGHLRRIVHATGQGRDRVVATSVLHDLAFDKAADLPDERYAFRPPDGAREERTEVAQQNAPLVP